MTLPPPPSSSTKSSGEEPIVIPTVHTVTVTESEELGWELEGVVQATGSVAGVTAMAENVGEYGELLDEYGNKMDSADTSVAAARDPVSLVIRGVVRGGAGEGVLRRHNLLPYVTDAVIETLNGVAVTGEPSTQ